MGLKEEIQNDKGFLHILRKEYLPTCKEMADLAFNQLATDNSYILNKNYIAKNFESVLKELLYIEHILYNEKVNEFIPQVLSLYNTNLSDEQKSKYTEMNQLLEEINQTYDTYDESKRNEHLYSIFELLTPLFDYVLYSQKQSAKSRAGNSLQNHLSKLLTILEVPHDTQSDISNEILDFLIPGEAQFKSQPTLVLNIECQTTLKERFRLNQGRGTNEHLQKFIATASGCNLITSKDHKDITLKKLKNIILKNNITLIVFSDVKQNLLQTLNDEINKIEKSMDPGKIASELSELQSLNAKFDHKVITYNELVNTNITNTLNYWKTFEN